MMRPSLQRPALLGFRDFRSQTPVVVTVEAKPAFEMIPIPSDEPEFLDRLLEQHEGFRRLAEERRHEADSGGVSTREDVRQGLQSEKQRHCGPHGRPERPA
jgi:hypothetical protein